MSKEVREEFKGVIANISKEICNIALKKDVDELNQDINLLKKISIEYKNMHIHYTRVLHTFLKCNNENMKVRNSLDDTNQILLKALEKVDMTQMKIFEMIINSNKESLSEYQTSVRLLNESERKKFENDAKKAIQIEIKEQNKERDKQFNKIIQEIRDDENIFKKLDENLKDIIRLNVQIKNEVLEKEKKRFEVEEQNTKKINKLMILTSLSILVGIINLIIK